MEYGLTSIIILAYKEPEKFERMFEIILQMTDQAITPYEIIVVDNNADSKIKEYLKLQNETLNNITQLIVNDKNIGVTKAYNAAAKLAKGKYLCFFNSDYYVETNWLKSMIDCFEHKSGIGICSCCTNVSGNLAERPKGITHNIIYGEGTTVASILHNDYIEADCAIANMFTTKAIFDEVEGFDENYFVAFLDLDLNEKIKARGYSAFINRKTFAIHDYMSGKEAIISKEADAGRNYFHKKWGPEISDLYKWA